MTLLRSLLLSFAALLALSACVLPGSGGGGSGGDGVAPEDIEVTALPPVGSEGAADVVKPKPRPDSAAQATAPGPDLGTTPATEGAAAEQPASEPAAPADAAAPELSPLEDAPPAEVKTPGQIACEKARGRFVRAGGSGSYTCVRPTRDGGKRCTRAGNCEGVCLARSQTCSPFTPVFGCQEILQDDGLRITECIE